MGNHNATQAYNNNETDSATSIGSASVRIYGVLRHVLVGASIKPRMSSDCKAIYRWFRGTKIDSVLEATERVEDPLAQCNDWKFLQEGSDYVTNDDDLMHMMKVEAWSTTMNTDTPLCIAPFYVLSRLPAPPTRQMLPISNNNNPTTTTEFTPCYCDTTRYYHCPEYALLWNYRQNLLYEEIETLKPDILCLQELEENQFPKFAAHFATKDYKGEFVQRTSLKSDGCGTFFNNKKFKLVKKFDVNMDLLVNDTPELQSFPDLEFKTKRNNVAIILLLQALTDTEQLKYVWVSNCHLFWDPKVPEVKLMQAWYLLRKLHEFQQTMCKEMNLTADQFTTLACGDFNSLPDSMVYELHAMQCIKETIVPQIVRYSSIVEFTSPVRFESSYKTLGEPVSNYSLPFKGCLDYIWYQPATCTLLEVLENPTCSKNAALVQSVDTYTALPSPFYPSDHLPLMAKYALK